MEEKNNDLAKQMMLEEVITNAIQIPGVKVNRKQFLAEQFVAKADNLEEIIEKGPIEAGIKREDIALISKKLILTRTSQSSIASFVAGIPGGFAMAATIPYCGVMFGVSEAVSGVRVLSTQLSKTALKKIPQKALTKTFWYPIWKKIANFVGVNLTKKTFAQGVSKAVPVIE